MFRSHRCMMSLLEACPGIFNINPTWKALLLAIKSPNTHYDCCSDPLQAVPRKKRSAMQKRCHVSSFFFAPQIKYEQLQNTLNITHSSCRPRACGESRLRFESEAVEETSDGWGGERMGGRPGGEQMKQPWDEWKSWLPHTHARPPLWKHKLIIKKTEGGTAAMCQRTQIPGRVIVHELFGLKTSRLGARPQHSRAEWTTSVPRDSFWKQARGNTFICESFCCCFTVIQGCLMKHNA